MKRIKKLKKKQRQTKFDHKMEYKKKHIDSKTAPITKQR